MVTMPSKDSGPSIKMKSCAGIWEKVDHAELLVSGMAVRVGVIILSRILVETNPFPRSEKPRSRDVQLHWSLCTGKTLFQVIILKTGNEVNV
jgi:hypothetical protein